MSESKLATFRTDSDTWESFQAKAKRNGTNASSLLQRFLRDYLDGIIDSRIDSKSIQTDIDLDERIDAALEVKVDFSIRDISRRADDNYERLVAVVAQNRMDIDKSIDTRIDDKFTGIQDALTQRDHEIEALKLELETIKTAIATGNITSEATAPAKKPVIDTPVESDALPIIEAIEALPAPDILPNKTDTAAPELNQKQICDRYAIDYKNLSKKAGTANMTSDAYIMHIAKEHGEIWEKVASKGSQKLWQLVKTITP